MNYCVSQLDLCIDFMNPFLLGCSKSVDTFFMLHLPAHAISTGSKEGSLLWTKSTLGENFITDNPPLIFGVKIFKLTLFISIAATY